MQANHGYGAMPGGPFAGGGGAIAGGGMMAGGSPMAGGGGMMAGGGPMAGGGGMMAGGGPMAGDGAVAGGGMMAGGGGDRRGGRGLCGCRAVNCRAASCGANRGAEPVMSYVGGGCGDYVQETAYKYVGNGAGEFDVVPPPRGANSTCIFIGCGVGMLALLLVAVFLLLPQQTTTTTALTAALPYDCGTSEVFSPAKKQWCCQNQYIGCQSTMHRPLQDSQSSMQQPPPPAVPSKAASQLPTSTPPLPTPPPTPPTTAPPKAANLPFDCSAGFSNWLVGWSAPKKAWCCQHGGRGCATVPPVSAQYDCTAGLANWQVGWSDAKKTWCCQHQEKGCEQPAASALGECLVWGDPHILTFDKSRADFYGEGIKWLIKSSQVHVQARYKATPFTDGLAATQSIAVSGPFLQGHVLKVGPMENGQITWDDQAVLAAFPSTFDAGGLGHIAYNGEGTLVDSAQSYLDRHIVHMDFPSEKVHLQVMRWANHINVRISMPPIAGQDGHCGNFNQMTEDDTAEQIRARMGLSVFQTESLFKTYLPAMPGKRVTVDDCPQEKRPHANDLCDRGQLTGDKLTACIFDVCFGGDQYAEQDSVY